MNTFEWCSHETSLHDIYKIYSVAKHCNFAKLQKEKLCMFVESAGSLLSSDLNVKADKLIYKYAIKLVKMCIIGNICGKFTDGVESNVYYESTRNRNMLAKVS